MELKKQIYENAFHHYNRALGILGSKKDNPELWDILTWELSTSTFTWAQLMMDNTDDLVSNILNRRKIKLNLLLLIDWID